MRINEGDPTTNWFGIPAIGTVPSGYELIFRTAIVRLGPQYGLYFPTNHGCVGITDVQAYGTSAGTADGTDPYRMRVFSDFDGNTELALWFGVVNDAQLSAKGIFAGASGGGAYTDYYLYSAKSLSGGSTYPAWSKLPVTSNIFNSASDNLNLLHISLRRTGS